MKSVGSLSFPKNPTAIAATKEDNRKQNVICWFFYVTNSGLNWIASDFHKEKARNGLRKEKRMIEKNEKELER